MAEKQRQREREIEEREAKRKQELQEEESGKSRDAGRDDWRAKDGMGGRDEGSWRRRSAELRKPPAVETWNRRAKIALQPKNHGDLLVVPAGVTGNGTGASETGLMVVSLLMTEVLGAMTGKGGDHQRTGTGDRRTKTGSGAPCLMIGIAEVHLMIVGAGTETVDHRLGRIVMTGAVAALRSAAGGRTDQDGTIVTTGAATGPGGMIAVLLNVGGHHLGMNGIVDRKMTTPTGAGEREPRLLTIVRGGEGEMTEAPALVQINGGIATIVLAMIAAPHVDSTETTVAFPREDMTARTVASPPEGTIVTTAAPRPVGLSVMTHVGHQTVDLIVTTGEKRGMNRRVG
ncbi:Eukaryotic translation initiation factor 3 subunit A [Branchiostoma belcheri]|nr:Eukaryotic translation initiation factor 3 subunit A [Branchiostoma belcheri]